MSGMKDDPGTPESRGRPGENDASAGKGGGGRLVFRAALVFAGMGLIWFGYWRVFLAPWERTDDAYVVGNQVRIVPRTSGTVSEIFTDDTRSVIAGQLLVRLDPTDATLAYERAGHELAQAVRQISGRMAERDRLKALIEAREMELKIVDDEWARRRNLRPGSSVTAEELERYRSQSAAARAVLRAARHELEAAERGLGLGPPAEHPQARLAAVRLNEAWLDLKRCEIRSPVAGRVARRNVQVGAHVGVGTPLMVVVPDDEIWVEANFKESQLTRVKPGHRVEVEADMYGGRVSYGGVVTGLAAGTGGAFSLLPPENATGNWIKVVQRVPVRIALDRARFPENPLLLGLSLRVRVAVSEDPVDLPPLVEGPVFRLAGQDDDRTEIERVTAEIVAANLSPEDAASDAPWDDASSERSSVGSTSASPGSGN
jgi:membrane fusion protein (multidrug efflux system)